MKPWMKWTLSGLVVALIAAGALRTLSARSAAKAALDAHQASAKATAVLELTSADVVQVRRVALARGVAISGPLKAVNAAFVKARIAGELRDLTVREGDTVKAGQVIARIDPTEAQARLRQAQQQAESARAQVEIAQRSLDNNRALVNQGFISSTALATSSANLAAMQANFQAAQAGAEVAAKALADTVLRAPISGQVAQRLAQPGERVTIDARLVEIVDVSRMELEASLSATDSLKLKLGQSAQVTVEGDTQARVATLTRINPSAMAGSRAVLVYLNLADAHGLRQGLFAQGTLQVGAEQTLALPLTAVRSDKPQPYVQLVSHNKVVHQTVTLGERGELLGQTLVAVQGVAEGASVLSGTLGAVRNSTPVKTMETK